MRPDQQDHLSLVPPAPEPTRPPLRAVRESGIPPRPHQAAGLRVVRKPEESPVLRFRRRDLQLGCVSFAITSGKGGVGKTQLSANLGVCFAQRGLRVLMLDADVGLASLDLALGIKPHDDLRAVIRGEAKVQDVLCEGPAGVHIVPACPGRYDMANMSTEERGRLQSAVQDLARGYDVLLVDTGAGIGSNAVAFAGGADEAVLVVTPDPTSLRDAYAMAKVLHRRSGIDQIRVVANQVHSDAEGAEIFDRLNEIVQRFMTLQLVFLGSIAMHAAVRSAVVDGTPYVLAQPESLPARAVQAIARRLLPPMPKQVS
ncbi:MAG: MinD/ParA family protein [Myxococcota bacterium]